MNMKTIPELDWRRIDLLIALALEEDRRRRNLLLQEKLL